MSAPSRTLQPRPSLRLVVSNDASELVAVIVLGPRGGRYLYRAAVRRDEARAILAELDRAGRRGEIWPARRRIA